MKSVRNTVHSNFLKCGIFIDSFSAYRFIHDVPQKLHIADRAYYSTQVITGHKGQSKLWPIVILATDLQMLWNLANDRKTILKLGVLFYQTFSEFLESIIKTMIFFKVFRDVILSIMDIFPKFKRSNN